MDISDWTRKLADSPLWQAYWTWRHPSMVCVVLAGRLYGVELQEGRFLRQGSAVLPDMTEEAVATAFRRLEAEGLTRKNVVLLVNFPKLRLLRRKYPAMTKEELEETMYWEEDRLFRTEEPLSLGYEIMDSGPEGWDVHVEAVPKETLALFEKGARDGGKEISSAIPVTAVPLEDGCFALYGRRRSAILTFRKGKIMESRILRREDQGKAALFLDHVKETWGAGGGKSYFLPMADCGEEERTFWKDWLRKDLAEAGNPEALAFVDSPFREGPSLWQDLAPLWPALDRAALELPLSEKRKPFLSEETKYLRLAEGACLLGVLCLLASGGQLLSGAADLGNRREESRRLAPQKEEMVQAEQDRKRERDLQDLLKELDRQDGKWERRLVSLAESLPPGIVISEIEGKEGAMGIRGTAQSYDALRHFQETLSQGQKGVWQGGKKQKNTATGLIDFHISIKGEGGKGSETKSRTE